MDADPGNPIFELLLILCLTLVNAFFASAEMAVVSVNKSKIRALSTQGNKKAQLLEGLIDAPTDFLSAIQIGITLAGFFSSAAAASSFSDPLGAVLTRWHIPYGPQIAFVVVTVILSYFNLIFGELVPKRIALKKAETVALFSVRPVVIVKKIAIPFIRLLSFSTHFVLKLFGFSSQEEEEQVSEEEILLMAESGVSQGTIPKEENQMIRRIFDFDDKQARDIMTPRPDVYMVNADRPLSDYFDQLIAENYSRVPVYENDRDHIVGILYLKDLLSALKSKDLSAVTARQLMRQPYFVPEHRALNQLFQEMNSSQTHISVLVDEYGGFAGIVTIEDLVEEIMGEINDEYDESVHSIQKLDDGTYLIKGSLCLFELEEQEGIHLEDAPSSHQTLSHYFIQRLGYIPGPDEHPCVISGDYTMQVEKLSNHRIQSIRLSCCNK